MKVPIKDIQNFMKSRSAENMAELLGDKIAELDRAIQDLKAVRSKLCTRYMDMDELLKLDFFNPEGAALSGNCTYFAGKINRR